MSLSDNDRSTIRDFIDAVFDRLNRGVFDEGVAKVAIDHTITQLAAGSRADGFEYMCSVIAGQGE